MFLESILLIYKNKKIFMSNNQKINHLKQNISGLKGEMESLNEQLDLNPEDLLASDNLLDNINDIEIFDYKKELEEIQEDSNETLECLSKLYLSADDIDNKNLSNIIKNDSEALSDLKFSLSCSKRGLINLMTNIDMGVNDPEMYQSISSLQKEIRDTIKMLYDIQKKMKDFYKEIREELSEIRNREEEERDIEDTEIIVDDDDTLHLVDMDKLTEELDNYKDSKNKEE